MGISEFLEAKNELPSDYQQTCHDQSVCQFQPARYIPQTHQFHFSQQQQQLTQQQQFPTPSATATIPNTEPTSNTASMPTTT